MSPVKVNLVQVGLPKLVQVGLFSWSRAGGTAPRRSGTEIAGASLVVLGSATERRRSRLLTSSVAAAGALLLAAEQILQLVWQAATLSGAVTVPGVDGQPDAVVNYANTDYTSQAASHGLVTYLTQPGLLGGAALVPSLLAGAVLIFAGQALKIGTAARERRLAALSLAGATRSQLRRLAAREGMRAAVRGAVLAGPGYLVLWLLLGVLPRWGYRLLPPIEPSVYLAWAVGVPLLALAGGAVAALSARTATVSPLGITRRVPRPLSRRSAVVPLVALAVAVKPWLFGWSTWPGGPDWPIVLSVLAAVVFALGVGPFAVRTIGRRAERSDRVVTAMAGRRLLADPRPAGRVAGVLFAVGLTLGVESWSVVDLLTNGYDWREMTFYLGGVALVAVAAVVALLVACLSMVVAASEQVLEGRRGIAVLVSLAASPDLVQEGLRRQLGLVAVPAALAGALAGMAAFVLFSRWAALSGLVCLGLVLLLARGAAALAALAVRPVVRECSGPENLRAA